LAWEEIMEIEAPDTLPRELMTIPLHRYRKFTTIHVRLKPEAADLPKVLTKTIQPISRRGIAIVGLYTSTMPEQYSYITMFIDSTKISEEELKSLIDEIRMNVGEFNADVRVYTSPVDGVAIDPYSFPITAMGSRAIIIMYHSLRGIISGLSRIGAEMILNIVGREIGKAGFEIHERMVGRDIEKLMKLHEARFMMSGFGIMKVEHMDMEAYEFTVKIMYSIECEILEELKRPSGSYFIKGILEGWFSELTGKDMVAYEEKCISRGDPYCQFKIKPRST
jgi:predicted hydrocarbon binding protein